MTDATAPPPPPDPDPAPASTPAPAAKLQPALDPTLQPALHPALSFAAAEPDRIDPTPAFQRANRPLRMLAAAENALMVALLAGTVGVILAQVFFRYVLEQPLSWSNEAATDLLVYVAFVGFAIGVRDNAHVALHLFERRIGARSRRWLRMAELVVLGAVLSCIGIGGAVYLYEQRDVVSPVGIPLWSAFLPLPVGAVLGMVHIIVELIALGRGAEAPGLDPAPQDTAPQHPAPGGPGVALPGGAG